jgi:transcriptional regulator with XRE-family HTH domain
MTLLAAKRGHPLQAKHMVLRTARESLRRDTRLRVATACAVALAEVFDHNPTWGAGPRGYISSLEAAEKKNQSITILKKLARALGVPVGGAAGMTATTKKDKFKQFAAAHALRGDAVNVRTKPTDSGLLVTVSCSCGASTVDTLTRQECAEVLTLRALERDEPQK